MLVPLLTYVARADSTGVKYWQLARIRNSFAVVEVFMLVWMCCKRWGAIAVFKSLDPEQEDIKSLERRQRQSTKRK